VETEAIPSENTSQYDRKAADNRQAKRSRAHLIITATTQGWVQKAKRYQAPQISRETYTMISHVFTFPVRSWIPEYSYV
jgi:hypothetical protein